MVASAPFGPLGLVKESQTVLAVLLSPRSRSSSERLVEAQVGSHYWLGVFALQHFFQGSI